MNEEEFKLFRPSLEEKCMGIVLKLSHLLKLDDYMEVVIDRKIALPIDLGKKVEHKHLLLLWRTDLGISSEDAKLHVINHK